MLDSQSDLAFVKRRINGIRRNSRVDAACLGSGAAEVRTAPIVIPMTSATQKHAAPRLTRLRRQWFARYELSNTDIVICSLKSMLVGRQGRFETVWRRPARTPIQHFTIRTRHPLTLHLEARRGTISIHFGACQRTEFAAKGAAPSNCWPVIAGDKFSFQSHGGDV